MRVPVQPPRAGVLGATALSAAAGCRSEPLGAPGPQSGLAALPTAAAPPPAPPK